MSIKKKYVYQENRNVSLLLFLLVSLNLKIVFNVTTKKSKNMKAKTHANQCIYGNMSFLPFFISSYSLAFATTRTSIQVQIVMNSSSYHIVISGFLLAFHGRKCGQIE